MIQLTALNQNIDPIVITAILDTALCVGAGGASDTLADKSIVRNAAGNLIIPASQLKGRLRHECEKLARGLKYPVCSSPLAETMCPQRAGIEGNFEREDYEHIKTVSQSKEYHCIICQIFGNPSLPSRIIFEDLICEEKPENLPKVLRPGVTINRRRKTAEENKLYFLETSPMNLELTFKGQCYLTPDFPDVGKIFLLTAFKHIQALGGSKSSGLGWLTWQINNLKTDKIIWEKLRKGVEKNVSN